MMRTLRACVPAAPGWCVLTPVWNDEAARFTRYDHEPVLAWFVEVEFDEDEGEVVYRRALAITIRAEGSDDDPLLLRPDGTVRRGCECDDHENEVAALVCENEIRSAK